MTSLNIRRGPGILPHSPSAGGINLVARARPYFGLIVLTTALLSVYGVVSMLRMPSGIYPEVAFPRIVVIAQTPGLAVKDVEVAVTRPVEEAVSIVLGVVRVRSKSVRGAAELSIDFAPETDMIQALNDIRARMAEVGRNFPPAPPASPSVKRLRFSRSSRSWSRAAATRRRFTTTLTTTCGPGSAASLTFPTSPSRGATSGRSSSRSNPRPWPSANLSIADIADRLSKEHRLKAVGRLDRGALQYQVLSDTQATDPLDLENVVIAEKNGQAIRLRDLGRVTIGHEDRTMAIRSNGKDAVALTVFRRLGGNALAVSHELEAVLADARQECPAGHTASSRSTTRASWSGPRLPTCATPS